MAGSDWLDVREAQLSNYVPLEVMPALARFDENHLNGRLEDGDRKARESGAGSEIRETVGLRVQGCPEGCGIKNQPPGDCFPGPVTREVDATSPVGNQFGEGRQLLDGLLGRTQGELRKPGLQDFVQLQLLRRLFRQGFPV